MPVFDRAVLKYLHAVQTSSVMRVMLLRCRRWEDKALSPEQQALLLATLVQAVMVSPVSLHMYLHEENT